MFRLSAPVIHFRPDDNWSIQSKRFPSSSW